MGLKTIDLALFAGTVDTRPANPGLAVIFAPLRTFRSVVVDRQKIGSVFGNQFHVAFFNDRSQTMFFQIDLRRLIVVTLEVDIGIVVVAQGLRILGRHDIFRLGCQRIDAGIA